MKIHCLGTTGFHPSPTRHTACYYLPELALVLDAGTGIFRLIDHLRKEPKDSLTVLLSHAHLDHVVGLTFLIDALAVTSLKSIRLMGEPAKLDAVRDHLYHELLFPVEPMMDFVPLVGPRGNTILKADSSPDTGSVGCAVEWFPLEHPGGCVGYILRALGKKIAYVTDTVARADAEYVKYIRDADLLLHECYFGDDQQELAEKTGHSWLSAVCKVVDATQPKQTLLIHMNPLAELMGFNLEPPPHPRNSRIRVAEDEMTIDF